MHAHVLLYIHTLGLAHRNSHSHWFIVRDSWHSAICLSDHPVVQQLDIVTTKCNQEASSSLSIVSN